MLTLPCRGCYTGIPTEPSSSVCAFVPLAARMLNPGSATSICPVYCRFCFRSYTVGAETDTVKKQRFLPLAKKWEPRFQYIENTPALKDVVISGGDTYLLEPAQLEYIGERLLGIPHIRRFRFATKGLAVSPSRLLDPQDDWVDTVIRLEKKARRQGKHLCIHTHFNSANEISWVTRQGAQRLYEAGVTVRNQTVLLNGVNNTPERMCRLVHALGDINIQPVCHPIFVRQYDAF